MDGFNEDKPDPRIPQAPGRSRGVEAYQDEAPRQGGENMTYGRAESPRMAPVGLRERAYDRLRHLERATSKLQDARRAVELMEQYPYVVELIETLQRLELL